MKKPLNLRLPVLFAASLALGILYSATLAYCAADGLLLAVPAAIFITVCITYLAVTCDLKRTACYLLAVLIFIIGSIYLFAVYKDFCAIEITDRVFVKISGKVVDSGITSGGSRFIILDGVTAYNEKLDGKVLAYITDKSGDYCAKGYSVSFYAYLTKEKFFSDGAISSRVIDGIRYYCSASALTAKSGFSLFGQINYAIEKVLFENLGQETAAVCFALLTGSSTGISKEVLGAFRYGGISHIFAVSGLHIGVVYGVISFVCKRAGVNRFVATAVRIVLIFIYSGVCNFTPSSVRAVIMCAVFSLSSCFYRKNDRLNSISIAAIVLLSINPFYLFDTGFLLSFSAVLGIILLGRNLSRALRILPKKLRSALTTGWSAQFATVPALMYKFGYVSAAGIILNVIFIPVISVLYVVLFAVTVISLIIPPSASVLLQTAALPIEFFINVISYLGFEKALIEADFGIWLFVPFIFVTVAVSDKFNFRPIFRIIPALACAAVFALLLSVYYRPNRTTFAFDGGFSGGYVILHGDGGTVIAMSENFSGYIDYGGDINALVVLGDDYSLDTALALDYSFDEIYLRGGTIRFDGIGDTEVICSDAFSLYGFDFSFEGNVLYMSAGEIKIALVTEEEDNMYGKMPQDTLFNLYCYGDGPAVLYRSAEASFDLTYCGKMSYTLIGGRLILNGTVPKEP